MALNINGTSDQLYYEPGTPWSVGCIAGFFKNTGNGFNPLISHWSSSSRNGWGLFANGVFQGYAASARQINLNPATTVNDNAWYHIAVNFDRNASGTCEIFVDGVSKASGTNSGSWTTGTAYWLSMGHDPDSFWSRVAADYAMLGYWTAKLGAAEIAALAKGYSPHLIRRASLRHVWPFARSQGDRKFGLSPNASSSGGGVSAGPHISGGLV